MTIAEAWTETVRGGEADLAVFGLSIVADAADLDANDLRFTESPNPVTDVQTNDENWTEIAACRDTANAADVFFSEELPGIVEAKRICASCPVIAPCLEGAINRAEPCGVWGGQLFENGQIITRKRRRGRPPKVARPEDQLPNVPIPAHLQQLIA